MGVRGMDISNHQAGMDVERVVRENNIGFVFVLSNDGTFKNPYYRSQMDAARRGGAIAVPYNYLRTNVDQTYETFRQQEPAPCPVIVDVEDGSGGRAECDRMHSRLHNDGYSTPLLYWPDWYRKKVGSPSLAGLPPLWTSWYPDYVNRGFDDGLAQVPAWVWNGYGGLSTLIVQFTSSGRLSGYGGNLDLNYFPGSRAELDALLLGGDDMAGALDEPVALWPTGSTTLRTEISWLPENFRSVRVELAALKAAVLADVDLTPEQLDASIEAAVAKHTPTAAEIAKAQEATLVPVVDAALKRLQDADNIDEAKQTAAELLRQLAALVPPTPQES